MRRKRQKKYSVLFAWSSCQTCISWKFCLRPDSINFHYQLTEGSKKRQINWVWPYYKIILSLHYKSYYGILFVKKWISIFSCDLFYCCYKTQSYQYQLYCYGHKSSSITPFITFSCVLKFIPNLRKLSDTILQSGVLLPENTSSDIIDIWSHGWHNHSNTKHLPSSVLGAK